MAAANSGIENDDVELALWNGSPAGALAARQGSARLRDPEMKTTTRRTFQSVQSGVSRVASFIGPLNFMKIGTQRNGQEPRLVLSPADVAARDAFFGVLLRQDGVTLGPADLSAPCVMWYSTFLECRFRGAWTTVVREALRDLQSNVNEPQPDEIGVVYKFLSMVAKLLLNKERRKLAMVEIVDQAANVGLFKDQKDTQRAIPNQLVFEAVGWLTMLYDPDPSQSPGQLRIRKPMGTIPRTISRPRTRTRPSRTFTRFVRDGFEGNEQSMCVDFVKFGHLIPESRPYPKETELITVSHVCFSILDKVADVTIEWVNSLSEHLEFDNVRRILKIFRFPSFCMLMYRDLTCISNVYLDHDQLIEKLRADEEEDRTPEYFREVLLSYRLIFGQHKASWKAFNAKVSMFPARWGCSDRQSDDADPMLSLLCGSSSESWQASQIYEIIDAIEGTSPYYYPESDFPFLGRRILELQAFVSGRHPHSWKGLWNDKRNIGLWWTFWAVIIIGGSTIILQFIQTAFQIWGSALGYKQLNSSNCGPNSTS